MKRPISICDLLASERRFLQAMHSLCNGRFEDLRIEAGEVVLNPWRRSTNSVSSAISC